LSVKTKSKSRKLLVVIIGMWLGIFLGVGVIVALVFSGVISLDTAGEVESPVLAKLENDTLATDFDLENIQGEQVRLSDLRGKVVVVNYWATWCGPCVEEMPMFQEYQDKYPGFVMISIDQEEGLPKVRDFIEKIGIRYQILMDYNGKVAQNYKVFMLPTTHFIDENGMIRFRHIGVMTEDQFQYYLRTLGVIQ
jgi:peroxiredoxin